MRVVGFYVGLISSCSFSSFSSFSSSSLPHNVRRCAKKTVKKNVRKRVSSSPPLLLPSVPPVACRTSTAIICAQSSLPDLNRGDVRTVSPAAAPQPRSCAPSVPCRTSTEIIRCQHSLLDLNRADPWPVFPAGPQCQKKCQKLCQTKCRKECEKMCQKYCQEICKECQTDCEKRCQKECRKDEKSAGGTQSPATHGFPLMHLSQSLASTLRVILVQGVTHISHVTIQVAQLVVSLPN